MQALGRAAATTPRTGERRWEAGTSAQGVRAVGLPSVGRARRRATCDPNSLDCDGQHMRRPVDGRVVGTFTIDPGARSLDVAFPFASGPVLGGMVTLRYENAHEVRGGCGSARFDKTASMLELAP